MIPGSVELRSFQLPILGLFRAPPWRSNLVLLGMTYFLFVIETECLFLWVIFSRSVIRLIHMVLGNFKL